MGETKDKQRRRRARDQYRPVPVEPHGGGERWAPPAVVSSKRPDVDRASGDVMAIPKVMGIETEYGITVKNQPDFNPILSSLLLINSYETYRSSRIRWDYEAESPLRDARGFEYMEEKEVPVQGGVAPHQPDPLQRRALLRRPRPPGVLLAGDHQSARLRDLGPGRRADPEPVAHAGGGGLPARAAHPDLQEQHRLQGQLLRHPRELPHGPQGAVRPHRPVPDALLRDAGRSSPARARSARRTTPSSASTRSPSGPTSWRPRSGSRRCTAAPSSIPATSRTPIPRSTAGCTSSSGDANMSEVSNYLKCGTMAIVLSMIEDDFIDRDLSLDSPVRLLPPRLARPRAAARRCGSRTAAP